MICTACGHRLTNPPSAPVNSATRPRWVSEQECGTYGGRIDSLVFYTSFVGRRALLATVRERLASSRVVTLVGPGGVGKSRVAVRTAEGESRSFRDGCWVVPLAEVGSPDLLIVTVAEALGLQGADLPWRLDMLADHIAQRTALMALDNCEHLLSAVGDLVDGLRAACPNLRFLLTSRRPLRLSGEEVVVVPPLELPEHAGRGRPGSDHPLRGSQPVRRPCQLGMLGLRADLGQRAGGGHPLPRAGRDPAGDRARRGEDPGASPQEICDSLAQRLTVLHQGYRDASDRHQSLRACVEWSYDLCTELEQRFWARSSVFTGGFDLRAATVVCAADDLPADEILDLVGALVDQSVLVAMQTDDGHTRFRMLSDIRQFGLERAEKDGELIGMQERHATWALSSSLVSTTRSADQTSLSGCGGSGWSTRTCARSSTTSPGRPRAPPLVW